MFLKRKNILEAVYAIPDSEEKRTAITNYIATYAGNIDEECKEHISIFYREFLRRWNNAKRMKERFLKANAEWLEDFLVLSGPSSSTSEEGRNKGGRPSKEFDDNCNRVKRRKTEDLRRTCSSSRFILLHHHYINI